MFLKVLEIVPTSPLTLRRMPMSHKMINSYGFIPPTVLSGFLFRLLRIAEMKDLPKPRVFDNEEPCLAQYNVLENKLVSQDTNGVYSLGGYPETNASFLSFRKTGQDVSLLGVMYASELYPFRTTSQSITKLLKECKEKGLNSKNYKKIDSLVQEASNEPYYLKMIEVQLKKFLKTKAVPQIPQRSTFRFYLRPQPIFWEFVVTEKFNGFLISSTNEKLDLFDKIKNFGFKIGKEGFAYVSQISKNLELRRYEGEFISSTIMPINSKSGTFTLEEGTTILEWVYYFDWERKVFVNELFAMKGTKAKGYYYADENRRWQIPLSTLEKFGVSID